MGPAQTAPDYLKHRSRRLWCVRGALCTIFAVPYILLVMPYTRPRQELSLEDSSAENKRPLQYTVYTLPTCLIFFIYFYFQTFLSTPPTVVSLFYLFIFYLFASFIITHKAWDPLGCLEYAILLSRTTYTVIMCDWHHPTMRESLIAYRR